MNDFNLKSQLEGSMDLQSNSGSVNNVYNEKIASNKVKLNESNSSSATPNSMSLSSASSNTGKTCLVCRRRKIKCDKTKPVCMKCIKHNSTMDCMYDSQLKGRNKHKKSFSKKERAAIADTINTVDNLKAINSPNSIRNQLNSFLDNNATEQAGLALQTPAPKKRGRPPLNKANFTESVIEQTPLISLSGNNNGLQTIYLTENDNLANKQKINNMSVNYISPVMNNMQQKLYKRRYSKILLEEQKETLLKQRNELKELLVDQQAKERSYGTMEMITNMQRDNPGKISGKFADLSIIVQKRIKRQRLLKEFSTLKKQLESMESLIDGSIQEEEMDLEELEMKFDRCNPREYDSSNLNSPINSGGNASYHIFSNISKMSFYDGFEQVTVFNARLNFIAPLSAQVVLKKDPFGKVVSIMVDKTLHEYATTLEVKKSSEKYDALRVTDSNSLPTLIGTANNSTRLKKKGSLSKSGSNRKESNNAMLQIPIVNISNIKHSEDHGVSNPTKDILVKNTIEENEEAIEDDEDDNEEDDDDENSNDYAANEMFNKKFLENEGIDEMTAIIKEGKVAYIEPVTTPKGSEPFVINHKSGNNPNNKFSTSNLRSEIKPKFNENEEDKQKPEFSKVESSQKPNLKPENDPTFWSNLNKVLTNIDTKDNSNSNSSNSTRVPEGLFGSEPTLEHELVLQIQDILPPGKIINIHCKNFFKSPIYGLYPILNEDWWMDTMHRLLGFSESQLNSEQSPKVNIARRFDIAKLATLLVMLRLSYFVYPDTLEECTTDEERLVLKYPIGKEFISLAQRSLNIFKMVRKGILPVLHCALLLRVYRKYAPEEGDIVDGSDSETFTGFLIKMSTSIGLNTDVARSGWVKEQKMYVDQWRKCWYCVYFFDFIESCNMGNTSSIDIDSFDTKLPDFKLDPLTGTYPTFVIDSHLEDIVVSNYQKNFETTLIARDLLSCITNKRLKFSVPNLQMLLNNLSGSISKNFGDSLKSIIALKVGNLANSVYKLNCFIWFIELKVLQFYCYIHIFIHIDEQINANLENIISQGQLTEKIELFHFYLKKIIEIYVEIEPVLLLCYDSSKIDTIFGRGSKFIVIQACENLIIRFIPGLHIIASRFLHFKFNYLDVDAQTDDHISKISEEIINCLMDKLSHSGGICRLLSKKYFQMWRISQSNQFIFYLLNKNADENLFKKDSKINNLHREEWQYHNGSTFEDFFPFRNIPMYNFLTGYQLNHFQEVFSILNSVKWNIFNRYYTESELKQGIHYRDKQYETSFQKFLKKNGSGNKRGRKNYKTKMTSNSKTNISTLPSYTNHVLNSASTGSASPLDEANPNKNQYNQAKDNPSATNSIASSSNHQNNIAMDEIDKYWYDNYLSNNNDVFVANQQSQNYQNLDDLFDGSNQDNGVIDNQIGSTDKLKNQVIEKLANLVPEESGNSKNQKVGESTKENEEFNAALQSFFFNNGNTHYSDEINF